MSWLTKQKLSRTQHVPLERHQILIQEPPSARQEIIPKKHSNKTTNSVFNLWLNPEENSATNRYFLIEDNSKQVEEFS
jgi:hypothetical protein